MIYPIFSQKQMPAFYSYFLHLVRYFRMLCTLVGILFVVLFFTSWLSPYFRPHMGSAIASVLPYQMLNNPSFTTDEAEVLAEEELANTNLNEVFAPFQRIHPSAQPMSQKDLQRIAKLTPFLAKRYKVSEKMIQSIVQNAFTIGYEKQLDPLLLLAVISVESRFNPVAESSVGAQGLMQVMANVHRERFKKYGGKQTALDPLVNMMVGSSILKEYIKQGGSVQEGLRRYVGATGGRSDGGYRARVATEYARLANVVGAQPIIFVLNDVVVPKAEAESSVFEYVPSDAESVDSSVDAAPQS